MFKKLLEQLTNLYDLSKKAPRPVYAVTALLIFTAVKTVTTAIHELSHGITVLLVGGALGNDPFFITPIGGYTRWTGVPEESAALVNIAGSLGEALAITLMFVPLFVFARNKTARWVGYWGICVFLNITFYWLISPIISSAKRFDTVAFAGHIGIDPIWIGIFSFIPFCCALFGIVRATGILRKDILIDPDSFHGKVLVSIYALYFFISLLIMLQITDKIIHIVE